MPFCEHRPRACSRSTCSRSRRSRCSGCTCCSSSISAADVSTWPLHGKPDRHLGQSAGPPVRLEGSRNGEHRFASSSATGTASSPATSTPSSPAKASGSSRRRCERQRRTRSPSASSAPPRAECLDWLLIVNRRHLERVLRVFVGHYNSHRPHRSLNLAPPEPSAPRPRALPGWEVLRAVRRAHARGGCVRGQDAGAGAAGERDRRTMGAQRSKRMLGSRPGVRAAPSRADPSRLCDPLQRRAPAPLVGACRSRRRAVPAARLAPRRIRRQEVLGGLIHEYYAAA